MAAQSRRQTVSNFFLPFFVGFVDVSQFANLFYLFLEMFFKIYLLIWFVFNRVLCIFLQSLGVESWRAAVMYRGSVVDVWVVVSDDLDSQIFKVGLVVISLSLAAPFRPISFIHIQHNRDMVENLSQSILLRVLSVVALNLFYRWNNGQRLVAWDRWSVLVSVSEGWWFSRKMIRIRLHLFWNLNDFLVHWDISHLGLNVQFLGLLSVTQDLKQPTPMSACDGETLGNALWFNTMISQ